MVNLAKMDGEDRDEIHHRLSYKKLLDTCKLAKKDRYEWVWLDTCCIDKQSSAELSEAINSMYRWYGNAQICYAYLHDVHGSSFPTKRDDEVYYNSNGWPEWFARGWTLQEMIAPQDVRFFNTDWKFIGDKKTLTYTLTWITGVPKSILRDGLSGTRPCVAQIMSWAAGRTTTQVEDRAYSLMGLLDVNMPMSYGEGKKAFHRLQLEIIRMSNDQSIFVWGQNSPRVQTGSILADNPCFFEGCSDMGLMDYNEFIQSIKVEFPGEELPSIDQDHFGVFPITNHGIQIWMLLRPHPDSKSLFQAWLPCRDGPFDSPETINLALSNSNYYRYTSVEPSASKGLLEFHQVYLRYQDTPDYDVTFEINDTAIIKNSFACCYMYPMKLAENKFTLTGTDPLCIRTYAEIHGNGRFSVVFGQYLGQDWVYLINNPPNDFSWHERERLMLRGPEHVKATADVPSRDDGSGQIWVHHIRLSGSTWIIRSSRVVWKGSRIGLQIEGLWHTSVYNGLDEWRNLDVEAGEFSRAYISITL